MEEDNERNEPFWRVWSCIHEGRILCIRKTRGPYRGRYDLPGGTPEEGESLVETLKREMLEETGFQVSAIHQNTIRDVFVTVPEIARVHHEFVLFTIDVEEKNAQTVRGLRDERREE